MMDRKKRLIRLEMESNKVELDIFMMEKRR